MTRNIALKLAIVGSRDFTNYKRFSREILGLYFLDEIDLIISGGAFGADTMADKFAVENEIDFLRKPAKWKKLGRRAGFVRNEYIIREADEVIAFQKNKSKGTQNSIEWAKKLKKKLTVIDVSHVREDDEL